MDSIMIRRQCNGIQSYKKCDSIDTHTHTHTHSHTHSYTHTHTHTHTHTLAHIHALVNTTSHKCKLR
jgi:hypothetical protein